MKTDLTENIINDYISGLSMEKVASKYGIGSWTVNRTLIKNNIPKRNFKEAAKIQLAHKDKIILSNKNKEILTGNLIGDGSVLIKKKRAFYTHTDTSKSYLEWLQKEFEKDGITFSPLYQNSVSGNWVLQSHTYSIFNEYRDRFYVDNKRIIPEDIELTPLILRQWYISDGSVTTHGGRFISRLLGEPENLLLKLRNLFGQEVTYPKRGFYIPVKYVNSFLDYIGNSPDKSYDYKWRDV